MGALSSGNYALEEIQSGMTDFVTSYSLATSSASTITKNFFLLFSLQQGGFTLYAFAHSFFLALMGAYSANLILTYVTNVDEANGDVATMTSNQGLKGLLFGVMLGAAGYLGGLALANRAGTILEMVGMNGYAAGNNKYYDVLKTIDTDQPLLVYLHSAHHPEVPRFFQTKLCGSGLLQDHVRAGTLLAWAGDVEHEDALRLALSKAGPHLIECVY